MDFMNELSNISKKVEDFIFQNEFANEFKPDDISESIFHYTKLGGKRLRPAVLYYSCGAVGGNPENALPACASVEMFHTWTLVHDDIIDNDDKRRHGDTVHKHWSTKAKDVYHWDPEAAKHYGITVAVLAGDVQQGWSIGGMLPKLYWENNIRPEVVLTLMRELDYNVLRLLVEGETLDVLYSTAEFSKLNPELIIDMLKKKTGVLYGYCGLAGAMIGLNSKNKEDPRINGLSKFAENCGIAFQIQDDVLGIVGEEDALGKPVGSDIREGKRTLCLWKAYLNADNSERNYLNSIVGKPVSSLDDIHKAIDLIETLGGVDYAKELALAYINGGKVEGKQIEGGLEYLDKIEESPAKTFLKQWADFMIYRKF